VDRRARVRVTAVLLGFVLLLAVAGGLIQATATGGDDGSPPSTLPPVTASVRHSDLPAITVAELPPEALQTIALISRNGPYPYEQDGTVFSNREGILPPEAQGYYREYTVPTPGSPDRGARRLVVGAEGEVYYTDDHYTSFSEVLGDG